MKFPQIGKLQKGSFYVMEIEGGCTLHIPMPENQRERDDLIDRIEGYSIQQYANAEDLKAHTLDIEVDLDPEPPELA